MVIKRTRITYEIEMLILGVYQSGITNMTGIVEKTKVSDDTVRRVLKKHGLKVSGAYTKITPEIRNRVKELRAAGMSYKDIAVEMHIGISTTRDICVGHKKNSAEVPDDSAKVEVEQLCLSYDECKNDDFDMLLRGIEKIERGIKLIKDGIMEVQNGNPET